MQMHEFSIAADIVDSAIKEAEDHKAKKIKEILLEIGQLTLINPEQLEFAIQSTASDTIADGLKIRIEILPVEIECEEKHRNKVEYRGKDYFLFLSELKCPECGKPVRIISGKECILKRIVAE
ncbi:MAG TPA: hydrogenase maturation nickel metallochaperone HypA [Candidatus Altiarchaeales archaeon]|nr:hydrogenase maturation nickel metallochaperone HypA [Candidatus Altiarchaeales archaeon]